jgi:carotenoid cleavage dioxygenase-like enzyme
MFSFASFCRLLGIFALSVFASGEFAMAAAHGAGTDQGWLIGFVYDRARDASVLTIFDAQRVKAGPVARILLPKRVPQGFHGAWFPEA